MIEDLRIVDRPPLSIFAKRHIGDNRMTVELGVHVAGRVVPKDACEHFLTRYDVLSLRLRIPNTRVQKAFFDVSQCGLNRRVMSSNDPVIAADKRDNGNGFRW